MKVIDDKVAFVSIFCYLGLKAITGVSLVPLGSPRESLLLMAPYLYVSLYMHRILWCASSVVSHPPKKSQALHALLFVFVFVFLLLFVSYVYFGVCNNLIRVSHLPRECQPPHGPMFVFFSLLSICICLCVYFGVRKDLIRVSQLPRESQAPYGLFSRPNHLSLHTGHWTWNTTEHKTPRNTGHTKLFTAYLHCRYIHFKYYIALQIQTYAHIINKYFSFPQWQQEE